MGNIDYINGQFVDHENARIPASDLSILRGYGVFDYLRTYGGRPFHLQAHLERLQRSAQLIGLTLPNTLEQINAIIEEALERNALPEAAIRIVVTGGDSPDNITPVASESRLLVLVTPPPAIPPSWFTDGVKVITHTTERYLPEAKTLNYIPAIIALQKAHQHNAVDALYVNHHGHVLEGTTTNLFAFYDNTLITPGEGILRGITRQAVMSTASSVFATSVQQIQTAELLKADEVFITSSNKEICPVTRINDTVIGSGKPGPNTLRLREIFRELTTEYAQA
ncbi:MAG: aminotransferase class IV [Anaerolineae bacterium]|nr:aminotransferase class IV [Anaerolineae bacterium]